MVALSLVVALVALVVAVLALRRADVVDGRVSRRLASSGGKSTSDGEQADTSDSETQTTDPGRLGLRRLSKGAMHSSGDKRIPDLVRRISALESRTFEGISRVAVVRYDAFEGAGGQLSYSLALVDEQGAGLVLTAIHGQAETRTYVKEITHSGDSGRATELSPEEREVLRKATGQRSRRKAEK